MFIIIWMKITIINKYEHNKNLSQLFLDIMMTHLQHLLYLLAVRVIIYFLH